MQGRRTTHEDEHIMKICNNYAIFAVLDGHGGKSAVKHTRTLLEEALTDVAVTCTISEATVEEVIRKTFLNVDKTLRALLNGNGSGTTVVAAVVVPGNNSSEYKVHVAHAGDSRAMVSTGGVLGCTNDHKPSRPDELARIQASGGCVKQAQGDVMRVDGNLAISRAFGDFSYKPAHELHQELCRVTAVPEVMTVTCRRGDWLFLGCDGIFDVQSNSDVKDFVTQRSDRDENEVVTSILQHSLSLGSKDNCTGLLVRFSMEDAIPCALSRELVIVDHDLSEMKTSVLHSYANFLRDEGFAAEAMEVEERINKRIIGEISSPIEERKCDGAISFKKTEEPNTKAADFIETATLRKLFKSNLKSLWSTFSTECGQSIGRPRVS